MSTRRAKPVRGLRTTERACASSTNGFTKEQPPVVDLLSDDDEDEEEEEIATSPETPREEEQQDESSDDEVLEVARVQRAPREVPEEEIINLDPDPEEEIDSDDMEDVRPAEREGHKSYHSQIKSLQEPKTLTTRVVCPHCFACFLTKSFLERHIAECPVTKTATASRPLDASEIYNLGERHCCPYCPEMFLVESSMWKHINRSHPYKNLDPFINDERHACPYCPQQFLTEASAKSHINRSHSHVPNPRNKMKVKRLNKEKDNSSQFKYPRIGMGSKSNDVDNKKSNNELKVELNQRRKLFGEEGIIFHIHCINCRVDILEGAFFDAHLDMCLANKIFQCSFCGQLRSSMTQNVLKHMIRHFYKPMGYCSICDMNFINKYNLQCHHDHMHYEDTDDDPDDPDEIINVKDDTPVPISASVSVQTLPLRTRVAPLVQPFRAHNAEENINPQKKKRSTKNIEVVEIIPKNEKKDKRLDIYDILPTSDATYPNLPIKSTQNTKDEVTSATGQLKLEIASHKPDILSHRIRVFCNTCGVDYVVVEFLDHILACFQAGKSTCMFCTIKMDFLSEQDFLQHMRVHLLHHHKRIECSTCDTLYLNHFNFQKHIKHFH